MNVTVEELAPCKKLVRIEVETEKVEEGFDGVIKEFQREARLPGFRPGKAPKDMVLKRFEPDIEKEVKKKLMTEAYRQALSDHKLNVVGSPDIEEIQFGRGKPSNSRPRLKPRPILNCPITRACPSSAKRLS